MPTTFELMLKTWSSSAEAEKIGFAVNESHGVLE
jgi:hypothetical protein